MLETTQMNPSNAFKDIECYKMVYKKDDNHCISYVMGFEYTLGEENVQVKLNKSKNAFTDVDGSRFFIVANGYHSYARKEDIQPCNNTVIVRCIIPAGSQYYTDDYGKYFASTNIKILEFIS